MNFSDQPTIETNQPWRIIMKKTMLLASAAMICVGFLAAHAKAQGVPQTVEIAKVDVQKVAVGGFLGMGTHMVVVRYDSLKFADNKIVLPGGTKDGLKMLPAFQYSKE